uniref:Uncharacterized protein n=1 Tax=Siphoviridae sp. ctP0x5 TaxID=2827863 RepID=A0A8S5TF61_9CAUD|nr:MAG TPA: hypothetical protein [Siphoviridae sp. ctP0x5]
MLSYQYIISCLHDPMYDPSFLSSKIIYQVFIFLFISSRIKKYFYLL